MMKNIIKCAISLVLVISIVMPFYSCGILFGGFQHKNLDMTIDGISYVFFNDIYIVKSIDDFENSPDMKTLIIPDYLNGYEVDVVGDIEFMVYEPMPISCEKAERLYFPWSISICNSIRVVGEPFNENSLKYIFSCTNVERIGINADSFITKSTGSRGYFVITQWLYDKTVEEYPKFEVYNKHYLRANIAFFFNYEDNPNEGYFFIDLLEETGTITKPPYNPQREGYTFSGWFKDEACTQAWDFENDTVEIVYDEEGNRIYEEIKLYAKWE